MDHKNIWKIQHTNKEKETIIKIPKNKHYYLDPGHPSANLVQEPEAPGIDLKYEQINPIMDFLGFSQQEIAEVLEVDPSTLFRWKKNERSIGKLRSKAMFEIDEIIAKGVAIFGSESQFKEWLQSNNYSLGDQKPIDLLKDPYQLEVVNSALEALSWGNLI